jgi:anti-sigma regulatory factor (Ser/Thr protein kinase)
MKFYLPNGAHLQNITGFLKRMDPTGLDTFELEMHQRWVFVHPAVLALTACAAELVRVNGGVFSGKIPNVKSLAYPVRMKLFDYVKLTAPFQVVEHEGAGRFIPLTQIKTTEDLRHAIANLVPLFHARPAVADPIKYVFSEMVRNVLEHSKSPVGAFVAAQYYKESGRIAIGIADAGIGILEHMRGFHGVETSAEAISLALRPGITGTTGRIGGNQFNAGAGLFFTKSIASFSKNMFLLYSGDAAYRLMTGKYSQSAKLFADPLDDNHLLPTDLPRWQGTLVGIDINVNQGARFAELLDQIRKAYYLDVRREKDYAHRIKFT